MRLLISMLLCALGLAGAAFTAEPNADAAYELHEWGVFSVPRNDAWAQHDMKQEWAQMPKEFYGWPPGRTLPYRGPVRKPVIFFHAEKALQLDLTIRFAEGAPMVWWPAAAEPANFGSLGKNDGHRLVFSLFVKDPPQGMPNGGRTIEVPEKHWVASLRAVKSEKIHSFGSHSRLDGTGCDSENFIYYDGLMKAPATPKVTRDGDVLVLETSGGQVFLDLMAIERSEKGVRIAKAWSDWNAQVETKKLDMRLQMAATTEDDLKRLRKELAERLTKAGLNADEAESLVKVWDEGIFKNDGLTIFYRVPQETYEKWLPLQAKPAPAKTVRVGLVLHEHMEPELDAQVDALLKKLGAEAFEDRSAAQKELTAIGAAAFPALEKAAQGDDAEIAKSCRAIINALDATPALKDVEKK
ncbi:MAG: hypothetical protein HY291_07520 [Planctomycetes bacterium]|nr:hypothetical protein [Planctomycetota bacterium]